MAGGDKFRQRIKQIAAQLNQKKILKIGFFENATYPDGTYVAYVAFINEFGATINVEAREQTVYRQISDNGNFKKNGRFVKKSKANFSSTHNVAAHTIIIPARPAFRQMIEANKSKIGGVFENLLKHNNYDVPKSLNLLGSYLKDELYESYTGFSGKGNAKSTIRKKGFDDPLVGETKTLIHSIGIEVSND